MLKNEASLMENEERRLREVGIFTLYDWASRISYGCIPGCEMDPRCRFMRYDYRLLQPQSMHRIRVALNVRTLYKARNKRPYMICALQMIVFFLTQVLVTFYESEITRLDHIVYGGKSSRPTKSHPSRFKY